MRHFKLADIARPAHPKTSQLYRGFNITKRPLLGPSGFQRDCAGNIFFMYIHNLGCVSNNFHTFFERCYAPSVKRNSSNPNGSINNFFIGSCYLRHWGACSRIKFFKEPTIPQKFAVIHPMHHEFRIYKHLAPPPNLAKFYNISSKKTTLACRRGLHNYSKYSSKIMVSFAISIFAVLPITVSISVGLMPPSWPVLLHASISTVITVPATIPILATTVLPCFWRC